jgi:hypothetical protein
MLAEGTRTDGANMGATRDYLLSSIVDGLLPLLKRPVEDVVYEVLDRRKVPTHTEFEEGQVENRRLQEEISRLQTELEVLRTALAQHEAHSVLRASRKGVKKEGSGTEN